MPSLLGIATAAALFVGATGADDTPEGRAFFEAKVRPVLVERCYACHAAGEKAPKGGLRLDTREGLRKGGDSGPAVTPGKPEESPIIQAIEHAEGFAPMPPKGKLPEGVVANLRRWVEMGAPDPRSEGAVPSAKATGDPLDWWSLKPLVRPEAPAGEPGRETRSPIDAFIGTKLKEAGLSPAPEADRRTLIRRLSFDLLGLPPTPGEIDAFLTDERPDAYERLVDRLLASPHYGERWARHWMDAVHFAETHGHDQDRIRPNAWPYRDYLIDAFNRDTPYARFVEEQVAADVLFPGEPGKVVALGFLASGPWDESSLRDIREDSIDRQIGHYLDRDDVVTTTMATFVSSTAHCARCHDHKFDPISQADYYGLQAVFAGVEKANRAFDPDPEIARRRKEWTERRDALRRRDPALLAALLDPAIQADTAAWESSLKGPAPTWEVLDPESFTSTAGATLTEEADHSVYSSGTKPAQDTTIIRVRTDQRGISAIRLETLADDRLPLRGPGRCDNGNLHLTEFSVFEGSPTLVGPPRPIAVAASSADFEQAGWGIAAAVDGNEQTAWGIYPAVGKSHRAVFELAKDAGREGGTTLTFVLQQTHPAGHLLGRVRLSASTSQRPIRDSTLPDAIAAILVVPAESRSPEQKRDLAAHALAADLDAKLAALPPLRLVYSAAADFAPDASHKPPGGPRPVHVLRRGDIHHPGASAVPGALTAIPQIQGRFTLSNPGDEGSRRAALARWITDPSNPLTWRSIVNRVWHHHFGRGLVDTPDDFGRMGSRPTHPELLDRLAADFRDDGGSLKRLHRRIVTSATYRQSSRHDDKGAALDADNRLLWRQNRRRLDAESVRDAILQASGRLDTAMGGPSVRQFEERPGVHVTPVVDYSKYTWEEPGAGRRSVYRFVFRTLPDPFMDSLDAADASQLTPSRNESITPLQALALLHNRFVLRHAGHFARALEAGGGDWKTRLDRAFLLTLGRPPTDDEVRDWSEFAAKRGLADTCRLIFNSNEFLFVD